MSDCTALFASSVKREIDFEKWAKKYEEIYEKEKSFILYKDDKLGRIKETSPYFENISKSIKNRGYLLKEEFFEICMWKTKRQKNNYKNNDEKENEEPNRSKLRGIFIGSLTIAIE